MIHIKVDRKSRVLIFFILVFVGCLFMKSLYYRNIYGDLTINKIFFDNTLYELRINGTHVASVSEIDTWYIRYPYFYGTIYQNLDGSGEDISYMIYNCERNEYSIYHSGDSFKKLLNLLGLDWKNFMSGENAVKVFYNNRDFSKECTPE